MGHLLPDCSHAALLGIWLTAPPQTPDNATLSLPPREARLVLEVQTVFQAKSLYGSTSGIAVVRQASELSRVRSGAPIYFRLKPPAASTLVIQRGQWLQSTGVLTPIATTTKAGERDFQTYLKDSGIHYRFERNQSISELRPPTSLNRFCRRMNLRFRDYLTLGSPLQSELPNVYQAMLLGRTPALNQDQSERYRMTGTMHLFAISGLHIGVIAAVIAQGLALLDSQENQPLHRPSPALSLC